MAKDSALTGAAGENYFAFRLSAMGYEVGLTTRGARAIDLVVANPDTGKSIAIQTKTMMDALVRSRKWGDYRKWRVNKSLPTAHDTFFYAFVDLKDNPAETPDVFIVPSADLPPLLEIYPSGATLGSPNVTDVWCDIYQKDWPNYQNRWDIIEKALT